MQPGHGGGGVAARRVRRRAHARTGTWVAATELPNLGSELLEGVQVGGEPAFDAWLLAERRHVQAQTEDVLHEAALARLAAGRGEPAINLAARLVAMNPFDENYPELLIHAHAASGDLELKARALLDLACSFAVRHRSPSARAWVGDLEALSARTMMREFLARAYLYRFELGEADALGSA